MKSISITGKVYSILKINAYNHTASSKGLERFRAKQHIAHPYEKSIHIETRKRAHKHKRTPFLVRDVVF